MSMRDSLVYLMEEFRSREKNLLGDYDEGFTCGLYMAADRIQKILDADLIGHNYED